MIAFIDPDVDGRVLRRAAIEALGSSAGVRFVTADFSTIFARDNALAARDARGRAVLVVPRQGRGAPGDAEPLDRRAVERQLGVRVVASRFHWQGGNILFDGGTLAVGADTIAENAARLGLTADEVTHGLAAELGSDLTVLGNPAAARWDDERHRMSRSGQASYHIDLDAALLGPSRGSGQPIALVADATSGLALLDPLLARDAIPRPPLLSPASARTLMAHEYRQSVRVREPVLRSYRDALTQRGYRIVGVPELRTRELNENASGLPEIVYCNVLPGLNRRRPAVHYLPWNIPSIDEAAELAFKRAGARAIRVARTSYLATAAMERAAGLRCFCGAMP